MKPHSEITCCVVDHGLWLPVAQRLARDFGKVYYYKECERDFPTVAESCIGDGFDDVIRVSDFWKIKEECDLFVFPDVGFSGVQQELRNHGYPVWGGGDADKLETNRGKFLEALKDCELPVPSHVVIVGMTNLREYLRDKEDKWIKISKFRGDWETLHWRSWDEDATRLDFFAVKFGPLQESITFYVFDPIDTEIEDGSDLWCISRKIPSLVIHGMEAKDKAYLGTFSKFTDLPDPIQEVNNRFAEMLPYEFRQFFSTEVRITEDGEFFFIDPTLRAGSPPSQVQTEMIENYGEIILAGAQGECLDPVPVAKFGVQVVVESSAGDKEWTVAEIPDSIRRWFKPMGGCMVDNKYCFPPNERLLPGWLVAIGDTAEEAIESLKEYQAELPSGLECDLMPLADLLKEVQTAEEAGMEFTSQPVPEPETILS